MRRLAQLGRVGAALALGALLASATDSKTPSVAYVLSPEFGSGGLEALRVEMTFPGEADGETRVRLPESWAGERDLWRHLRDLTVEGASKVTEDGPGARILRHSPGALLTLRYRVVSGFSADPKAAEGQAFKPVVRPGWFQAFGHALFAVPEGAASTDAARFAWRGAPEGFGFATDLQHLEGGIGPLGQFRDSILVGGAGLKTYARDLEGAAVRVAVLGDYPFPDARFADLALRIVAAQRKFWGGDQGPFLITLAPLQAQTGLTSMGGTGLSDAFALAATTDAELEQLRFLLAHEYFHTWNPRRIGGMIGGDRDRAGYWLSEGFTEFYTWRLLLRSGVFSLEDFTAAWNDMLAAYASSSVRTEPNARVVRDFWNDGEVEKLPYQRGAMLAAVWDQRLRRRTGGRRDLDDVMLAMQARAKAARTKAEIGSAPALFPRVYRELGGDDVSTELDRFVERGEPILLPSDLFAGCARVTTATRPAFERGWDADATSAADNVVTGLRRDSPAYAAGLRDGMKILARDAGKVGDSQVEYVLRVREGQAERVIRFRPEGRARVTVQQVALTPGLDSRARAACVRSMSGL